MVENICWGLYYQENSMLKALLINKDFRVMCVLLLPLTEMTIF